MTWQQRDSRDQGRGRGRIHSGLQEGRNKSQFGGSCLGFTWSLYTRPMASLGDKPANSPIKGIAPILVKRFSKIKISDNTARVQWDNIKCWYFWICRKRNKNGQKNEIDMHLSFRQMVSVNELCFLFMLSYLRDVEAALYFTAILGQAYRKEFVTTENVSPNRRWVQMDVQSVQLSKKIIFVFVTKNP